MNISVSKIEIFNEVEKRSSLEGSVIPDRYDGVWAHAGRGALLDSYWIEGCEAVVQLLKKYITSGTVVHGLSAYDSNEVFTLTAEMPARFNTLLEGSISTNIKMLIACNIIARWLEVQVPEAAAKYKEEASGYSEELKTKLLYRIEPGNKFSGSVEDDVVVAKTESALSKGAADSVNVRLTEASLESGSDDGEVLKKTEAKLEAAEGDSVAIGATEAKLEAAEGDKEKVAGVEVPLTHSKTDSVELEQLWGRCSCSR